MTCCLAQAGRNCDGFLFRDDPLNDDRDCAGLLMAEIFEIVFPVFALAAIGYVAVRSGLLSAAAGDGLTSFVVNLAIPVLLFRSLAVADYSGNSPWGLWFTYLCGIIVAWGGAIFLIAFIVKRGYRASVIAGVAASFSNLVLVGIPLAERAFGPEGLALHFLLISVHLPFMMAASTFLMEFAVRADGAETSPMRPLSVAKTLLMNFAKNPLIIGILLGAVWHFGGWGIGGQFAQILDLIGRTAGPLALFALGMSFVKYGIRGNWKPAIGLSLLSVVVMPASVLFVGTQVVELSPLALKVAVVAAACPTGVNGYLFAVYFKVAEGLASSAIVIATLMSLVALPFWLSVASAYS
ncbi:AEC family transporter [Pseudahrensia aquimaris]|uniref:AEC family transporter n=1 Tax=Pseudahrensia aquimaris TaxID=744461 RepID=A0ABW3FB33_9HYPH